MKKTLTIAVALLLAPAFAQDTTTTNTGENMTTNSRMEAMHAKMMDKYDTDGDGKLSEQEKATAMSDMQKYKDEKWSDLMQKYDKDGDGMISQEEWTAIKNDKGHYKEGAWSDMISKYDRDGDGKISEQEFSAMKDDMIKACMNMK